MSVILFLFLSLHNKGHRESILISLSIFKCLQVLYEKRMHHSRYIANPSYFAEVKLELYNRSECVSYMFETSPSVSMIVSITINHVIQMPPSTGLATVNADHNNFKFGSFFVYMNFGTILAINTIN